MNPQPTDYKSVALPIELSRRWVWSHALHLCFFYITCSGQPYNISIDMKPCVVLRKLRFCNYKLFTKETLLDASFKVGLIRRCQPPFFFPILFFNIIKLSVVAFTFESYAIACLPHPLLLTGSIVRLNFRPINTWSMGKSDHFFYVKW